MKRPASAPESSPPLRRKRGLSEDERELWESVARQTKPLRKKPRPLKQPAPPPEPRAAAAKPKPAPPPVPLKRIAAPPKPAAPPPLAPLGRRERSHLSRGRKEIEARIDLHGMTQSRAHHALHAFLYRASAEGLTFVLVITGKGRSSGPESERGVLRRQVPHWLGLPEFRAMVVGYQEAAIGHGGEGALYVRIRRAR